MEPDRAAFEKWITEPPYEYEVDRCGPNSAWPGNYCLINVDLAWCAWQAKGQATLTEPPSRDPDGEVALDWRDGPGNNMLSISIAPSGRASYAWVIGGQRGHGSVQVPLEWFMAIDAIEKELGHG